MTGARINRALRLKFIKQVRAKGKLYLYFDTGRVEGGKPVRVPLPPYDDPGFGSTYATLLGHRTRRANAIDARGILMPKLIDLYQRSKAYDDLTDSSRRVYDIYLRKIEALLPTAPVDQIERRDFRRLFDGMADRPGAANLFKAVFNALMKFAVEHEYAKANPCEGIAPLKVGEHQKWPEPVLDAALESDDDRVRLLAHLLFYTAQRINDVLKMSWSDVAAGRVRVFVQKTKKKMAIQIHERLVEELARTPRRGLTIATRDDGKPLSEEAARKALKDFAASHGVDRVPHGIRKNAVISLLEADCSLIETAAVSGQSLKMVEYYAKQRDEARLNSAAVLKWERNGRRTGKQGKTA